MSFENFLLLEELARMNIFLFAEHRFYTTAEGITGFVYEEDDGAAKVILSSGENYYFFKGPRSAGIKNSTNRQKLYWKYEALRTIEIIEEAEKLVNS
jgi:hypothetical protein